jgi:hypothetical protein
MLSDKIEIAVLGSDRRKEALDTSILLPELVDKIKVIDVNEQDKLVDIQLNEEQKY